jgi:predicted amidophosphoribosyltransferase
MERNPYQNKQIQKEKNQQKSRAKASHAFSNIRKCPHCGGVIQTDEELCPHCMSKLHADKCSFCGATLLPQDTFCPECGNPAAGITCPKCGTLNFRGFCRKCHQPLTENAQYEIEKAQKEPQYKQMVRLMQEIAELELQVKVTEDSAPDRLEEDTLSDEDKAQIQSYREILANAFNSGNEKTKETETDVVSMAPQEKTENTVVAIKEKARQIQNILKEFSPDINMSPELQRDYYSARKVPVIVKEKIIKTSWICNYCGCFHNCPEECCEPWHGGTWHTDTTEIVTKTWEDEK